MQLSRDDIERFEQLQRNGQIDEDYFSDIAGNRAAKNSSFQLEGTLTILGAFLGFALLQIPGFIAALLIGGGRIIQKCFDSSEQTQKILEGDHRAIAANLPADDRRLYKRVLAAKAVETAENGGIESVFAGGDRTYHHQHTVRFDVPENFWGSASTAMGKMPKVDKLRSTVTPASPPTPTPSPVIDSPAPTPAIAAPVATTPEKPKLTEAQCDTAAKLAERGILSLLMIGGTGTAKSLTMSNALKMMHQLHPEIKRWIISAKCQAEESGYWSGFDRYSFYDFRTCTTDCMMKAFKEWYYILLDFKESDLEGILTFDEISVILTMAYEYRSKKVDGHDGQCWAGLFLEEFKNMMIILSSLGRSGGKAFWGISPHGALNALGKLTKAQIGAFQYIFNAQLSDSKTGFHETVYMDASNIGMAPSNRPSPKDEAIAKAAGCTILSGYNGRWFPTKRYTVPPEDPNVIAQFNSDRGPYSPSTASQPCNCDPIHPAPTH